MAPSTALLGVALCITGNTCISLGLNVQKLAHTRLDAAAHSRSQRDKTTEADGISRPPTERSPLLAESDVLPTRPAALKTSVSDPLLRGAQHTLVPVETTSASDDEDDDDGSSVRSSRRPRLDKEFLTSPLWWLGFSLLNLGELGNFTAYGLTSASVVAPLGAVTLVANVGFAPLLLGEPFRVGDLIGCLLTALGGITIVWSSQANDRKLSPEELLKALQAPLFIAYAVVTLSAMCMLANLSRTRYGDRFVAVDLSLCALAGGLTVLATKSISSFLNLLFLDAFRHWLTYPVLAVLLSTALIQVNFINKALQRFPSRRVVPLQYVSFALSTIVGSSILFREFDGVELSAAVNFLFGCGLSSTGVYLLTREPPAPSPVPSSPTHSRRSKSPSFGSSSRPQAILPRHSDAPTVNSLRSRKLSLTLGGTQYLVAHSSTSPAPPSHLFVRGDHDREQWGRASVAEDGIAERNDASGQTSVASSLVERDE